MTEREVDGHPNCGECLLQRMKVVALGPDWVCPECGIDYGDVAEAVASMDLGGSR